MDEGFPDADVKVPWTTMYMAYGKVLWSTSDHVRGPNVGPSRTHLCVRGGTHLCGPWPINHERVNGKQTERFAPVFATGDIHVGSSEHCASSLAKQPAEDRNTAEEQFGTFSVFRLVLNCTTIRKSAKSLYNHFVRTKCVRLYIRILQLGNNCLQ